MKNKTPHLDEPMNANERMLYGVNVRLNILIEQVSSLVNYIAEKEGVAVESTKVEEAIAEPIQEQKVVRKSRTKKVVDAE